MNLVEAIRSGRPWRRKGDREGLWFLKLRDSHTYGLCKVTIEDMSHNMSSNDIVADDYEIKPVEVTITSKQFWAAAAEVLKEDERDICKWIVGNRALRATDLRIVSGIARRLGLGGEGAE